jgi:predicted metal-dependent peptidase
VNDALDIGAWLAAFVRAPGFLDRYPLYAAILSRLEPVLDPSVKRMAVSFHEGSSGGRFYLHINVDSFVAEPQWLRGILLHEVHHVALGHLTHPRFRSDAIEDAELLDLALEMSANEHIEEPLPNPIVWTAYADFGIRAGQSSLDRYQKLLDASRTGRLRDRSRSGDGDPASRRVDDHRFLTSSVRDGGSVEMTRQLLEGSFAEARASSAEAANEDPERRLVAGRTPGHLLEALTGTSAEPEVALDWKHALAMFVARARAPVHTWSRPSRRFRARVGAIPGRTYAPRAMERPSLLVAIDTSMSMTTRELEEIARQLRVLAKHAQLRVVECDTEIEREYAFEGALHDVAGRGGTDLRPVFEPAFLAARKLDGVVYFTDGEGPTPLVPPNLPVLWILTKPDAFACPWGERASMLRAKPVEKATKTRRKRG